MIILYIILGLIFYLSVVIMGVGILVIRYDKWWKEHKDDEYNIK